jgi:hypothetical protein
MWNFISSRCAKTAIFFFACSILTNLTVIKVYAVDDVCPNDPNTSCKF